MRGMTGGRSSRLIDRDRGFWGWPRANRQQLRSFGLVMVLALAVMGGISGYRGSVVTAGVLGGAAACFLVAALVCPTILGPVYGVWMCLARVLAWINTRLLLGLIFYTLFLLIGTVMRLLRYDPLQRRLDKHAATYWQRREKAQRPRENYEHQF